MGSKMGFEYGYRFSVDDEIILRYGRYKLFGPMGARFVFETRTNFIVKGKFDDGGADEKVIDSETYDVGLVEKTCKEDSVRVWLANRLIDYWMTDDEIQEFVEKAVAFAKQSAEAKHGMIPIAVDIDVNVCTVQQEGESINATINRAIRSEYLYPIYLCPWIELARPNEEWFNFNHLNFLRRQLCWIRVEDANKGLSLMEECPICLRNPTIGSQICSLQCGHAFHYHCITRWLANNELCPMCRQQAHDAFSKCSR